MDPRDSRQPVGRDALEPDPTFWGPETPRVRRTRRRRRRTFLERLGLGAGTEGRALLAVVSVVVVAGMIVAYRPSHATVVTVPTAATVAGERIEVHVAGAVTHPGVVDLPRGARIVDALDAAGGALTGADLDRLDLAAPVRDGQQILVPATPTPSTSTTTTTTTTTTTVPPPASTAPG